MALTSYSDLSGAVSSWTARGDYASSDISNFVALFEAWVNRVLRVRQMETSVTLTPSNGVATLPSDYLQWRRVNWTGTPSRELEYVHPTVLVGFYSTITARDPAHFSIEGSNLETRSSDSTDLTLEYWQKVPSLETNATNWLMSANPDIYLYGALVEAYLFNQDQDSAVVWKQRRDSLADEIRLLDKASIGPGAIRVAGQTP